jgi:hypothetical protein
MTSPQCHEQQHRDSYRTNSRPACSPHARHCSAVGRIESDGPRGVGTSLRQWMIATSPPGISTRRASRNSPTGFSTCRMLNNIARPACWSDRPQPSATKSLTIPTTLESPAVSALRTVSATISGSMSRAITRPEICAAVGMVKVPYPQPNSTTSPHGPVQSNFATIQVGLKNESQ